MFRFLVNCPIRAVLVICCGLVAQPGLAQQFVIDDAGITDPGACQIEGWFSERTGWVLPACTPFSRTEITLGIGLVREAHGDHTHDEVEFVAQATVSLQPDAHRRIGASVVAGIGSSPFAQTAGERVEEVFAYVPITYTTNGQSVQIHLNSGWAYNRLYEVHRALHGVRADVSVRAPLQVIGEVFGEGVDTGFKVGLRLHEIPDLLSIDGSYGNGFSADDPGIGLAVGIAITPGAFFRPIRL
ncbi:hypothetical protein BH23BAC4_BH23BAC4_11690 [soil metagenome]